MFALPLARSPWAPTHMHPRSTEPEKRRNHGQSFFFKKKCTTSSCLLVCVAFHQQNSILPNSGPIFILYDYDQIPDRSTLAKVQIEIIYPVQSKGVYSRHSLEFIYIKNKKARRKV